jgi:hypothetical protein
MLAGTVQNTKSQAAPAGLRYDSSTDWSQPRCVMYGAADGTSAFCVNCVWSLQELTLWCVRLQNVHLPELTRGLSSECPIAGTDPADFRNANPEQEDEPTSSVYWCFAYRFDAISVWIGQERGIVVKPIFRSKARLAVALASNIQCGRMKNVDGCAGACFKRKVKSRSGRRSRWTQLQAENVFFINKAIADCGVILKYSPKTQCTECGIVKRSGEGKVADSEGHVMNHGNISS